MFETTGIHKIDLNSIRINSSRSEVTTKAANLDVGEGFEVKGWERDRIMAATGLAKKGTNKKFGTNRLGQLHFLVFRKA